MKPPLGATTSNVALLPSTSATTCSATTSSPSRHFHSTSVTTSSLLLSRGTAIATPALTWTPAPRLLRAHAAFLEAGSFRADRPRGSGDAERRAYVPPSACRG